MDVRLDAFCGVHHVFWCDGEVGWQRLRRDVDVPSSHDSDGCGDARDGAGQQIPLLGFGGHVCSCLQPESGAAMACGLYAETSRAYEVVRAF